MSRLLNNVQSAKPDPFGIILWHYHPFGIIQKEHFASLPDFARWTENYGGRKYTIEQEANEFAGRLLVPEARLRALFDEFAVEAERLVPNFVQSGTLRDKFAERVAPRFGVNTQVIAIRLDRDDLWPAR